MQKKKIQDMKNKSSGGTRCITIQTGILSYRDQLVLKKIIFNLQQYLGNEKQS